MKTSRDALQQLHNRLRGGEPTAPAELFELIHRPLRVWLFRRFRAFGIDFDAAGDLATDAIVEYVAAPERFNPLRSSLFTYLAMVARGDALNLIRGRAAAAKNFNKLVELAIAEGNNTDEQDHTAMEAARIMQRYEHELATSPEERRVLTLYLDGEKDTGAYASALGATSLSEPEQRALVKQCKDRIEKRLSRLGREFRK